MQNFHRTSYLANIWFSKFTGQKTSQSDNLKRQGSGEAAEISGNHKTNLREGENDANSKSGEKGAGQNENCDEKPEMADSPFF